MNLSSNLGKILFWSFWLMLIILGLTIIGDYGYAGDETYQVPLGHYVWDYMKEFGQKDLDYADYLRKEWEVVLKYGGLFEGPTTAIIDIFNIKNEYEARKYFVFVYGILAVLFVGLTAKIITKSWWAGLIGLVFIVLIPRFFGEIFNNPKDTPFAMGYIMSLFFMIKFIQEFPKPKWSTVLLLAIGFGIAIGVRIGGLLLFGYFVLFTFIAFVMYNNKNEVKASLKDILIRGAVAAVVGYLIAMVWWPYAHSNIISNPLEALSTFTKFPVTLFMIHDGMRINTVDVPANYMITWLSISMPLLFIAGLVLSIVILFIKKDKRIYLGLLLFAFLFPIMYIIYKHSIVHDGTRHIVFVWPPLAALVACSVYYLYQYFEKKKVLQYAIIGIVAIGLFHPLRHSFANHPNQLIYFNEAFGGAKNAMGYYELDYYSNSAKLANKWIIDNVKNTGSTPIIIGSNIGVNEYYYITQDTTKLKPKYVRWRERDQNDWDYYVAYTRFLEPEYLQAGHFPPGEVVYEVKVDGVPVTAVMKRKSKYDMQAQVAMKNKDLATASDLYAKHLAIDPSNEYAWMNYGIALANTGKLKEATDAITKAININSSNPEWMKIAAQLYQQAGDMNNANKYKSMAASKISEQF